MDAHRVGFPTTTPQRRRAGASRSLADIGRSSPTAVVAAVTGSGGLQVAELMGVPFVQEIAATEAIERFHPEADVVIELGGEDARSPTCAHPRAAHERHLRRGTGAFIDQMASPPDAAGLNRGRAIRAAVPDRPARVFAKTESAAAQPGCAHADVAASNLQAVATRHRWRRRYPIRGNVVPGGRCTSCPNPPGVRRALSGQVDVPSPRPTPSCTWLWGRCWRPGDVFVSQLADAVAARRDTMQLASTTCAAVRRRRRAARVRTRHGRPYGRVT